MYKLGPIFIRLHDITCLVLGPGALDIHVEVQVEFGIDNFPGIWIYISRGPTAHSICSVAAILGRISGRITFKQFKVHFIVKKPGSVVP